MNIKKIILTSYLTSLCITIILAEIDSDPVVSFGSLLTDIFFMSILCWMVILPIFYVYKLVSVRFTKQ